MSTDWKSLAPDHVRQDYLADRKLSGVGAGTILRGLQELAAIEREYREWLSRFSPNSDAGINRPHCPDQVHEAPLPLTQQSGGGASSISSAYRTSPWSRFNA